MTADPPVAPAVARKARLRTLGLGASFGRRRVLDGVTLDFADCAVTAIVGPSGCGKSTLLRCLNRTHEETPGAKVDGIVALDGANVYAAGREAVAVRRAIGMLLQHPAPFPTMSILDNAVVGVRYGGRKTTRSEREEIAEHVLRQAGLWDEVKDALDRPGGALSGGQQQRLCIARALATRPRTLLLDEPCASLDPVAASAIEALIVSLARELTIVVVTHSLGRARRIAAETAFFSADADGVGRLVERGPTAQLFAGPADPRTRAYLGGDAG